MGAFADLDFRHFGSDNSWLFGLVCEQMTRNNFSVKQKKDMRLRSKDVCESGKGGTEAFYGMVPGERCQRKAQEFDHVTADALKRTKIKSIDEGLHVCKMHHDIKTNTNDKPKIAKAKRIDEALAGIVRPKQTIAQRKTLKAAVEKGSSHAEYLERMAAKGKPVPQRKI